MKNEYITLAVIAGIIASGGLAFSLFGVAAVTGYITVIAVGALGLFEYGSTRKELGSK